LRRRWWAGYLHDSGATAREAPTHRLATRLFPNGTSLRAHDRGQGGWCGERHRGPSCSSWCEPSNAAGTPLPALTSEERKHEPRFLLPRSQATSLDREPADAEFLSRRGSLVADE